MSEFSQERRIDRGSRQSRQDAIEGKDSRLETSNHIDIFRYTAPALVAAGSIALGALSISRSRSLFTRVVAGAGSLATGTLALGAAFAEVKGDN